jgi:ribonuclease-3
LLQPLDKLTKVLAYRFNDRSLLELALTHRSVSERNNERLEFLGDAILGHVIAEQLFSRFPQASEGELTRMRANLVKGETLAKIGHELELGGCLRLGSGELKSGGFRRGSILACAVEAIIGAVSLDGGYEAARTLIEKLFATRLEEVNPEVELKDPKTRLQELLQARKQSLPRYEQLRVEGDAHEQTFYVACHVEGLAEPTLGEGASRRKAEQKAARKAYELITRS